VITKFTDYRNSEKTFYVENDMNMQNMPGIWTVIEDYTV